MTFPILIQTFDKVEGADFKLHFKEGEYRVYAYNGHSISIDEAKILFGSDGGERIGVHFHHPKWGIIDVDVDFDNLPRLPDEDTI